MAIQKTLWPHKVECYVKWLRLRRSPAYREASQEIRQLQERAREADERFSAAHDTHVPLLPYPNPNLPDPKEKQRIQKEYWTAEESARMAQEALTKKEDETRKKFDLIQWWDPDDVSVMMKDAECIVSPSFPVVVLDPTPDKRVDFYTTELRKEAQRALEREGTWVEPPRRYTRADKDGWLTLKVNLNAPLVESERAIRWHLRVNRLNPPQTRNRSDKVAQALETFVCYEETNRFSAVAMKLNRPVSTVKGQYVRGHVLVFDSKPTGSINHRLLKSIGSDPAGEFESHMASCSRCHKANSADEFCKKWTAFINRDHVALHEQLL